MYEPKETTGPSLMDSWPPRELAVVIGAGGMSMAVARRLGQYNRLLLCDIDAEKLDVESTRLRSEGVQAESIPCDITDPASVAKLADKVESLGGFSKLAHVTGLSPSLADWRTILAVNLIGPALVTEALLPQVKPGAAAVLISSLSAHMATLDEAVLALLDNPTGPHLLDNMNRAMSGKMTPQLAYMSSKLGVIRLARRLAVSWGAKGSRVVSLSPGLIASPQGLGEFKHSSTKYELLAKCPLQRQGSMLEIADAVEFLLSERASYINGIDLLVDGGLNAARIDETETIT